MNPRPEIDRAPSHRRGAKFVQLIMLSSALHALDEDGNLWQFTGGVMRPLLLTREIS